MEEGTFRNRRCRDDGSADEVLISLPYSSAYFPFCALLCVFISAHDNATIKRNSNRGQSLCVLLSHDGIHTTTEVCRDTKSPSWRRLSVFQLNLHEEVEQRGKPLGELNEGGGTTGTTPSASGDVSGTSEVTSAVNSCTQSLNPFAENFVPPPGPTPSPSPTPLPPPPPPPRPIQLRLRTSLVLYLRVLNDNLIAKEVVGEVAVDLMSLLRSAGNQLVTDRLGYIGGIPLETFPSEETLAVDTWIALRERSGELRVQILIKSKSQERIMSSVRQISAEFNHSEEAGRAPGVSVVSKVLENERCPEFEGIMKDGLTKTTLGPSQHSLDGRLLEIQEQYDFSAADGYRQGRPNEEADGRPAVRRGSDRIHNGTPDWPRCEQDAAKLRRSMQLAALRDRSQCIGERYSS